ncbi:MAG: hypothetical protein QOG43_2166, partial [Actinomycetota bacterium]|nr:hypothetical protein [Actinomycetota bacterium]
MRQTASRRRTSRTDRGRRRVV